MKTLLKLLAALLLFCSLGMAQVDSASDVGRAGTQLGTYDNIDLSNLYMGLQIPVLAKEGSKTLPFNYSIVGLPNVEPGVWGQTSANLSIPYPLFGGIGYVVNAVLCPSGSNQVWTAQYSGFSYVDGTGAYSTFPALIASSGTLGCGGSSATYRTASGSLTLSVSVNSSFLMTYTLTDSSGVQLIPNGTGGGFIKTGWVASTNFGLNAFLYDDNGNAQITTACNNFNCTSGTTKPVYSNTVGATTTDGNLTWTNKGKPAGLVTDIFGNSQSVTVTNLTGTTQTGGGSFADASRDYSKIQVWTYKDTMNMTPLTVTNPALTDSKGNMLPTVQTSMSYTDGQGNPQNIYLNESYIPETKLNAGCLSTLIGPTLLGVNSTIDGAGAIHGNSFASPTPYNFFPTSLVYPDNSQVGFQYESVPGSPAGSTTISSVGISNNLVTLSLGSTPAVGVGSPITKLVASGGVANGTIVATISGTNPWTVGMGGVIAYMSSTNAVWDGLPLIVTKKTTSTVTFTANYCVFFITCPSTLTVIETQGMLISNWTNISISGMTNATFLNNTSPKYVVIGGAPFSIPLVKATSSVANFYYTNPNHNLIFYDQPSVVLSNMVNGQFNVAGTISGTGQDSNGPYFQITGSFTAGTYPEQGVGLRTTATGTNFITFPIAHADYGPTADTGTLTNPGSTASTTGRLSQLTLPSGGAINYTYSGGTNNTGINCQDSSYATVTRTTSDGTTTFSHTPSFWSASIPAANFGQAFGVYNWAGLYAYGSATGLNVYWPYFYQYPAVQGQVTNLQITGSGSSYTVTATFSNGQPALVPGNPVFIYAPGTPIKSFLMNVVSVNGNTLTTDAGNYATGTFNGATAGYITTAYLYGQSDVIFGTPTGTSAMPTGTWASLSNGAANSTTTVTDPAGNETIYQFAGLRLVDQKVFQGTPNNAALNPGFESGLTDWLTVSPFHQPESGTVTCSEGTGWTSGCATYLDLGSTGALTDPWEANNSTGTLDIGLGTWGTGGCCQVGNQNTPYGDYMPLVVSSGTSYTGYLLNPPPPQFQVGASVTVAPSGGNGTLPTGAQGTFPITAISTNYVSPSVTWTNVSNPGLCPVTVLDSIISSSDSGNQLNFNVSGNILASGWQVIQGTGEPGANNRVSYNGYGADHAATFASFWGQPAFGGGSDTGTIGTSPCGGYGDGNGNTANATASVTIVTSNQTPQTVNFSYVTGTGSLPATYTAALTSAPPSGFVVGAIMRIEGVDNTGSHPGAQALDTCLPTDESCVFTSTIYGVKITAVTTNPPTVSWQFAYAALDCTTNTSCTGGSGTVSVSTNPNESTNVSTVQTLKINGTWTTVVTFASPFQSIEIGPFGTRFTFASLTHATWLNGKVLTPTAWDGQTVLYFTPPAGSPEPYASTADTGNVGYVWGDPGQPLNNSDILIVSNMTVPNVSFGDTITGIAFSFNWLSATVSTGTIQAQIVHNGVLIGTPETCTAGNSGGNGTCSFGSSTDLWGTSGLTYDAGFAIALSASSAGNRFTLCCGPSGNLGFSLSLNALSAASAPAWTTTTNQFYTGSHSATVSTQLEAQLFNLNSAGSKYLAINPGDIIQYGGYLLRSGGQGNVWYTCAFYDATDTFISQCPYLGPVPQSTINVYVGGSLLPTAWTNYQNTVTAPSNAAYATFYVEVHGSGNSNDSGGDADQSLTTVYADAASFIDLTTSGLLKEVVNCYNSTILYLPGVGSPQNCLAAPPVSVHTVVTKLDTYTYAPGSYTGPAISSVSFDSSGREIDNKVYNGGQSNFNTDTTITYGTYTGTLGTSANPSNCSPLANPALTQTVCYTATTDSAGKVLDEQVFQYDANGNVSKNNRIDASDVKNFVTFSSYSSKGQLATTTDPNGTITTYNNTLCNSLLPSTIYDSKQSMSFTIDCSTGNILTLTDANNQPWTWTYSNPLNRLTSFSTPMTTGSYTDSLAYTYEANSYDSKMVFNNNNSVTEHLQLLDGLGRLLLDQSAYSSSQFTTVQGVYNSMGMLSGESIPFLSAAGSVDTQQNPTSTLTYDGLGRPLKYTSTNGQVVSYSYSGLDILVTVGSTSHNYELDALGNVASVCDVTGATGSGPCGQQTAKTGYLTTFSYDPLGRVLQTVKNAQSSTPQTTTFSYDGFGRTISVTRPETGQVKYTWDTDPLGTCASSSGNPLRIDDAAGKVMCATYDSSNRQLTETYSVGAAKNFVYDSSTTFTCPNPANTVGKLAEAYTGTSSNKLTDEGFCYSPRGELTDVFQTTPNSGGYFHTSVTYWPDGSINTLSGVPGITGSFTYKPGYAWTNQVTGPGSTNLVTSVTSTVGTIPSVVTFGSGDTDAFSLDAKGNFSGYSSTIGGTTARGTWTWNTNGTPKTLALTNPFNTTAPSQSCAYTWDTLLRVTAYKCTNGATNLDGETYSYDMFGNIKKLIPSGFTGVKWNPAYNLANNRYSGAAYSYDANGRLLNDSINTYTWNVDGKVATLTNTATGVVTTYTYDAFGQLVEESSSNASGHLQYVKSPIGKVATTHSAN